MALFAHAGIAFGIRPFLPESKLWQLILLSYAIDIASPIFALLGVGSHNLLLSLVLTIVISVIFYFKVKHPRKTILVGCVIFSHWIIDFITWPMTALISNPPRMYIFPLNNSHDIGLGFYSSLTNVIIGELSLLIIGISLYLYWRLTNKTNQIYSGR